MKPYKTTVEATMSCVCVMATKQCFYSAEVYYFHVLSYFSELWPHLANVGGLIREMTTLVYISCFGISFVFNWPA